MKKILFSAVVSSFLLLLIGCQDNSINNPVSPQTLNKQSSTIIGKNMPGSISAGKIHGIIPVETKLGDPNQANRSYILKGTFNYTESTIKQDIKPVLSTASEEKDLRIELGVDATLTQVGTSAIDNKNNPYKFNLSSKSISVVTFNAKGKSDLIKYYPVFNKFDDLELVCRFTVTSDGLRLDSVALTRGPLL